MAVLLLLLLGGSLGPREAERRAHHHGRELERVAGRVDDRIVSAEGAGLGAPRWAGVLGPSLDRSVSSSFLACGSQAAPGLRL